MGFSYSTKNKNCDIYNKELWGTQIPKLITMYNTNFLTAKCINSPTIVDFRGNALSWLIIHDLWSRSSILCSSKRWAREVWNVFSSTDLASRTFSWLISISCWRSSLSFSIAASTFFKRYCFCWMVFGQNKIFGLCSSMQFGIRGIRI